MEVSGFCEEQNPMIYHGSMSNYYADIYQNGFEPNSNQ